MIVAAITSSARSKFGERQSGTGELRQASDITRAGLGNGFPDGSDSGISILVLSGVFSFIAALAILTCVLFALVKVKPLPMIRRSVHAGHRDTPRRANRR